MNKAYRKAKNGYRLLRSLILPQKVFINSIFKKTHGYTLDFNNPQTLNEKIHWLKIYDRTPLHTLCADKFLARNYIAEKVGTKYLVPLVFQSKKPKDIRPENLPDYPVIIKTNHDSGGVVVVKDKSKADWPQIRKHLRQKLRHNHFYRHREWAYKNIERRIVVERFLIDEKKKFPDDIRVHCFNGKPGFITIDSGRFETMKSGMYDLDWNYLDCQWTDPPADRVEKPEMLDKVLELAGKLSENFSYIRTDFYLVKNDIYVGELTFYPCAGLKPFKPEKWDTIFGSMLQLPAKAKQKNFFFG